jgi:anti-sigma-K factor RskA
MERQGIHELSAAYALDALAAEEQRSFEQHLARCAGCRDDLASFQDAAAALAYDVEAPAPPPALRQRILAEARSERATVVPLRRRWAFPAAAAAAVAAACAAIALGIWGASLKSELDQRADVVPLSGARGSLVVAPDGQATLILSGLKRAPAGKTYEIWVIEDGTPKPAGLFGGATGRTAVALTRPVSEGDVVAVTLEREGGVDQPTRRPFITAEAA